MTQIPAIYANVSKSGCVIHFNTLLPDILHLKGKVLQTPHLFSTNSSLLLFS